MINQQLVDYIKQQVQAGVAKDVVRKALVDAGWPVPDIDDSMKAGEPAVSAAVVAASPAAQPSINPVVAMGGVEALTRKPVVASGVATTPGMGAAAAATTPARSTAGDRFFSQSSTMQMKDDDGDHPQVKKFVAAMIAMGVVILLLAGALAFVYFNLNGQLSAAQGSGSTNSGQMATLQGQVQQLTADNTTLTAQVASLNATTSQLMSELGFFVAPMPVPMVPAPTSTSTSTPTATSTPAAPVVVTATVRGMLYSLSSVQSFQLITSHNVKVTVLNSKDTKVQAALAPLANTSSTVQLTGTHTVGSLNLTVTAVNGTPL